MPSYRAIVHLSLSSNEQIANKICHVYRPRCSQTTCINRTSITPTFTVADLCVLRDWSDFIAREYLSLIGARGRVDVKNIFALGWVVGEWSA